MRHRLSGILSVTVVLLFLGAGQLQADCPGCLSVGDYCMNNCAVTIRIPDLIEFRPGQVYSIPMTITGSPCIVSPAPGTQQTAPDYEAVWGSINVYAGRLTEQGFCQGFVSNPGLLFFRYPIEARFVYGGSTTYGVAVVGDPTITVDESRGLPDQFQWAWGDGATSTTRNASHVYTKAGAYTIRLDITSSLGGSANTSQTIEVVDVPDFTWSPEPPRAGLPVQFTEASLPYHGPTGYAWNFGNGQTSSLQHPSTTFQQAGTYEVTLTIDRGGKIYTRKKTVTVVAADFQADFTWSPLEGSAGQPIAFTDLSTPGATSWLWQFGTTATSTDQNPTHTFTSAGTYLVSLRVTYPGNIVKTAGKGVVVKGPPRADFTYAPAVPRKGETVQFTDASTDIEPPVTWEWSFGDGATSTVQNPSHAYANSGPYTVALTVKGATGNSSTSKILTVDPSIVAGFVYSPSTQIRQRQVVSFTDTSTGQPETWNWTFGDGSSSSSRNPSHSYERPGVYPVALTITKGNESSGASSILTVEGIRPTASFSYSPSEPRVGTPIEFSDTSTDDPVTWKWEVNGVVISTRPSASYTPQVEGRLNVTLTAGNDAGVDSATRSIAVLPFLSELEVSVGSGYGACFISGFSISNPFTVAVKDWMGTPSTITYSVDRKAAGNATLIPGGGRFTLSTSDLFSANEIGSRLIEVTAKNKEGATGGSSVTIGSSPIPSWLGSAAGAVGYETNRVSFPFRLAFPSKPWAFSLTFPDRSFMGPLRGRSFGLKETQIVYETTVRTDCTADDAVSGTTGFAVGFGTVTGSIRGKLDFNLSPAKGFTLTKGTIGFTVTGAAKNEMLLVYAFPMLSPFCELPLVDELCSLVKFTTELSVSGSPDFTFLYGDGGFVFDDFSQAVKVGAKAEVSVGDEGPVTAKVSGGGSLGVVLGPSTIGSPAYGGILRSVEGGVEFGLNLTVGVFTLVDAKLTGSCSFGAAAPFTCIGSSPVGRPALAGYRGLALTPLPVYESAPRQRSAAVASAPGGQVLVSNVSPLARPTAARQSNGGLLLAFLNENATMANSMQRTDVWTAVVGSASGEADEPRAIAPDDRQDLEPALTARADGSAVLVFSRIKNAALTSADIVAAGDLPRLHRESEVVASTFDPITRSWSAPVALTDNDVLDRGARVATLADGRVIAVWIREPGNQPVGTSATPAQVVSRVLSGGNWGSETVLASGLSGVVSIGVAANGNEATVAFSRDLDGVLSTVSDREIATLTFDGRTWSGVKALTTDEVADVWPRVMYDALGTLRICWLHGTDLVWQTPGRAREGVRPGSDVLGFADARLAASPTGREVLLWLAPANTPEAATNLMARVFDPASGTWSDDVVLVREPRALSSLTAYIDANDQLHVTGLAATIAYESATRTIEGQTVTIPDIPVRKQLDIVHLTFARFVDLAVDGPLATSSSVAPPTGVSVAVSARVRNAGLLPVAPVEVVLFEGDGATGRRLAEVVVEVRPGETRDVTLTFPYAATASSFTLVVDPAGVSRDADLSNNLVRFSYGNQRPLPCFQANALAGAAPFVINVDGTCSSDADGRVVSHAWSFGDGSLATGTSATHTYEAAGTHLLSLTVSDDVGAVDTLIRQIVVGPPSLDPRSTPSTNRISLPVVARAKGALNTNFVSDIAILNRDSQQDLVVNALYMPDGRSDTFGSFLRIPPGQTRTISDVIATAFGAPSGVGWVRFDLSQKNALVESRTYNSQPEGTAGVSVAGVLDAEALTPGSRRVFLQLWRPGYRVNVAFTNLSGTGGNLTAIAYDALGLETGRKTYFLPPYAHAQDSGASLFQGAGKIEMTADGGEVVPYVTTVDNLTGDGVYETGAAAPVGGTMPRMLPGIVRARGVNETNWRTDVRFYNPGPTVRRLDLSLSLPSRTLTRGLDLAAGETRAADDVVSSLFPEAEGDQAGVLFLSAPGPVLATARTYNLSPNGTYGVFVPSRTADELLQPGQTADLILLESDAAYRCNFAFAAFDEIGATVRVRAFDSKGLPLGEKRYTVEGRQFRQISRIFEDLGIEGELESARLEVKVVGGGRVYAYATVVDNRTGDGVFVEARR